MDFAMYHWYVKKKKIGRGELLCTAMPTGQGRHDQ